jgi:hypothetical protein
MSKKSILDRRTDRKDVKKEDRLKAKRAARKTFPGKHRGY